jgi:hypothetical protein
MLAMDKKGVYNDNVVSDVQIMVLKAICEGFLDRLPVGPNSISKELVNWAPNGSVLVPWYWYEELFVQAVSLGS